MKLLRVTASHFKNACDHFSIDLVAKSRKTAEDKEYELQEIADGLYTQNTMAIVGKNASGKTTAVDLLDCCYSILGDFSLKTGTTTMTASTWKSRFITRAISIATPPNLVPGLLAAAEPAL